MSPLIAAVADHPIGDIRKVALVLKGDTVTLCTSMALSSNLLEYDGVEHDHGL